MTVQEIAKQIDTVYAKWQANVVVARPGEVQSVKNYFGATVNLSTISSQIKNWSEQINRLAEKPKVSRSLSKNLIESLSRCITSIGRILDQSNNGVEWMFLGAGLGQWLVLCDYFVTQLIKKSSSEQISILDAAQIRLTTDLKSLQDGADIAKNLNSSWPKIEEQLAQLETSSESFTEILDNLSKIVDKAKLSVEEHAGKATESIAEESNKIVEAKAKFDEALATTREGFEDAENLKLSATNLLADITSKSLAAAKGLVEANEALESATNQQNATRDRLTLALRDAQMEGLAGSFTRMADKTEVSIEGAQRRFDIALFYLMLVGALALWFEISYGFAKTAEEFSFRLVRMLSLATPGIWIAWIASRKVSALNRVFTDYQYKSASALAYESYRQTVADAGNDALKEQLLAFAIRSFGENPTHYYDSVKNEASSPFESLLDRVPFLGKGKSESSKTAP